MPDARARIEKLAEQMHIWYLEACQKLHPESFNAKAQKPYAELSEEQKFLDRYIAERALSWEAAPAQGSAEPRKGDEWFVSAKGLDRLAAESDKVGATRYAEAYRIVAKRLREMSAAPAAPPEGEGSVPQASPEPETSSTIDWKKHTLHHGE